MASNIQSNTIDITYNGTTRPITFVWSNLVGFNMNETFMALTLYTFRDMIPNYQEYAELEIPFNYKTDKTATLELPVKQYNYTVETLGHGEIKGVYYNLSKRMYCHLGYIKDTIVSELGIRKELIKLIDYDGNEIKERIRTTNPDIRLMAVFESLETKMEEKGIEKELDYKSEFKEGATMLAYKAEKKHRLYDLRLIEFRESPYIVEKRTPKFVVLRDTRWNTTYRRKITIGRTFGEYVYLKPYGETIVMKDNNIKLKTPYSVNI